MERLLDAERGTLWQCDGATHRALFRYDVRCGTLMYRASYFLEGRRYEDRQTGEDVAYLETLLSVGARLERIVDPASYTCVRHGGNSTAFVEVDQPGWAQIPLAGAFPAHHQAFYGQLAQRDAATR